ncbi:MAG: manganese transporter [Gemmatimonadales bacterium]|nr:MAG: manganese transporter [Gemmatimonadales bacterium]
MREVVLPILAAVALLGGCEAPADRVPGEPLRVVTTIGMITDVVERVGAERVQVHGLMGAGIDPHLYRASAGDVRRLDSADIIFYNGLNLEASLGRVLEEMRGRTRTVAVAEALPRELLLEDRDVSGAMDPHVWHDVSLWLQVVDIVSLALEEADPQGRELFRANAVHLQDEMKELDAWIRTEVARIPEERRILVTAHDAFGYFGRAYGFRVEGLQGITTLTEAGAGDVQRVARLVEEYGLPAIFIESSRPRRNVQAVQAAVRARGVGVDIGGVLYSDALGDRTSEAGDYVGFMRENVRTIVEALRERPGGNGAPGRVRT